MAYQDAPSGYPVRFDVDYPEDGLDRLSTAFRLIWVIPITIVLFAIGGSFQADTEQGQSAALSAGGILVIPTLLMILFRRKYPRWWFDWNLELARFTTRVGTYFLLMRDEYPSTDEEQAVHLEIGYPDAERDLNRWLPLVKWLLAIPHYIVLILLAIVSLVLVIVAWFAILFTARYPRGIFNFLVGFQRWALRVEAYAFLLTTDRYPPFSLD